MSYFISQSQFTQVCGASVEREEESVVLLNVEQTLSRAT
jgi:hypothetical protein